MSHNVEFLELAAADLIGLYAWIEDAAGTDVADAYLARLRAHCLKLSDFPNRGSPRDDLAPGIRSLNFERRISIFYRVEARVVYIVHIVSTFRDAPALEM